MSKFYGHTNLQTKGNNLATGQRSEPHQSNYMTLAYFPTSASIPPERNGTTMINDKARVYISGPMAGIDPNEVQIRFSAAEHLLQSMGYETVNPTDISHLPFDYDEFMEIDLKMLSYCDGIYMLKGWKDSFGAQMELQYAVMKQHFVIYEVESGAAEC